jgi:hypothetical protein
LPVNSAKSYISSASSASTSAALIVNVSNSIPEYVGAPQKMWAWGFGFFLAALMFYLVVLSDIRGPVNILTCALCLGLLFFEAVFVLRRSTLSLVPL